MKAKINLAKKTGSTAKKTGSTTKTAGLDLNALGKRWVAGESIRALAVEAGMAWNKLQAKLRAAGYLRSHKGVVVPK